MIQSSTVFNNNIPDRGSSYCRPLHTVNFSNVIPFTLTAYVVSFSVISTNFLSFKGIIKCVCMCSCTSPFLHNVITCFNVKILFTVDLLFHILAIPSHKQWIFLPVLFLQCSIILYPYNYCTPICYLFPILLAFLMFPISSSARYFTNSVSLYVNCPRAFIICQFFTALVTSVSVGCGSSSCCMVSGSVLTLCSLVVHSLANLISILSSVRSSFVPHLSDTRFY